MKRKLLLALGTVALIIAGLAIWLRPQSYPADAFHLPRVDFKGIQQATRQAMWRKTFATATSLQTITQIPHSVRQLATARILHIDKLSDDRVQVQMRSRFGDYWYCLERSEKDWRVRSWRVLSEGQFSTIGIPRTRYRGPESFGATVSFGGEVWENGTFPPDRITGFAGTTQRPVILDAQFSVSLSNRARMTLGR